ncbi:MAG: hypothetical protein Q9223_004208 [Gallowayella weberi]
MVTGIEITGLTLAVFPIVVDGVERYISGLQIIKTWRRYRVELAYYQHHIGIASAMFRNTIEELLEGIVTTQDDITALGDNPHAVATNNPQYEQQLKLRLDHDYQYCVAIMSRMLDALKTMKKELNLDETGKILWDDYSTVDLHFKQAKLVLSKKLYRELIDEMHKANHDLLQRIQQSRRLEPSRSKRRSSKQLFEFPAVRHRVKSLWNALVAGRSWSCVCRDCHAANLRLEASPGYRFQVVLSRHPKTVDMESSWTYQLVEIESQEPLKTVGEELAAATISQRPKVGVKSVSFTEPRRQSSSFQTPTPYPTITRGPIEDICTTIRISAGTRKCLGFLADDGSYLHQHNVFLLGSKPALTRNSLQQVLQSSQRRVPGQGLNWRDSLNIAATLASSTIQLSGTGWLKEYWDSKDIIFLSQEHAHPDYAHPYLSSNIPPEAGTVSSPFQPASIRQIRCGALSSLGIMLVELCFGQSISMLRSHEDTDRSEVLTDWNTAMRVVDYVGMERGERYGDVVRRCLECPFDIREKNLDNEAFQRAVFDSIVLPLQEELDNFMGSLPVR